MKWLLGSILFLLFIPCQAEKITPTRNDMKFNVDLRYMSRQDAFDICKKMGLWPDVHTMPRNRRVGCNIFNLDTKTCIVITPTPIEVDDEETKNLGHEIDHCARGKYHD